MKPLPGRGVTSHAEKLARACKRRLRERAFARYGWFREPGKQAGRMLVTPRDGKIANLTVTFEEVQ